jgi:hypothetical protein
MTLAAGDPSASQPTDRLEAAVPEHFLPSRHGFTFDNEWPAQPAMVVHTPFGDINLGSADAGLCGGMVFAAMDYWYAGFAPAAARPPAQDPLYSFIVRRLLDSWHAPGGVVKYYEWMGLPDGDAAGVSIFGRRILNQHGLAWRTITGEWPLIRPDLDRGVPVPLGVVTVASRQPRDLAQNHQILAYGHRPSGSQVTMRVYDPNRGPRDDIQITFNTSAPTRVTQFAHNLAIGQRSVRGFFRTTYQVHRSPPR